ncbi:MAG: methyltransferase domain-containing protein [Alphaproteobacteria bacterium]|nr:methyltransferase domain-containing protein [Alphaproteobacteria bacterium]
MSLRLQCVLTLKKILEEKVFFNALKSDFNVQDTAFANKLILTSLRRKTVIENLLKTYLSKKIPQKNKILEYVLLLGATEILYMDTPDYAAINEYVEISKKLVGKFSANMVNAVLRKIPSHREEMKNKASFPFAFEQILKQDYSKEQIALMEQMLLSEPPLDITAKENPQVSAQKLNGTLFENGTIRLHHIKANIASIDGYEEGFWWVQDLAASLPVCLSENLKDKKVLDLCAAPGGKTAQFLSKGAIVTALDISQERLKTLKENMARLKLEQNLTILCADGVEYLKGTTDSFDFILLDAPCSATGTFRKHPEVLHFKTTDDVKALLSVQQALLSEASKHLQKDGRLVYCTCSLAKKEGEAQIKKFLSEHPDFELKPLKLQNLKITEGEILDKAIIDKQVLRTLPYHMKNQGGMDGFFAAILTYKK